MIARFLGHLERRCCQRENMILEIVAWLCALSYQALPLENYTETSIGAGFGAWLCALSSPVLQSEYQIASGRVVGAGRCFDAATCLLQVRREIIVDIAVAVRDVQVLVQHHEERLLCDPARSSTRILGRRTAPFPTVPYFHHVPRGFTPRSKCW